MFPLSTTQKKTKSTTELHTKKTFKNEMRNRNRANGRATAEGSPPFGATHATVINLKWEPTNKQTIRTVA